MPLSAMSFPSEIEAAHRRGSARWADVQLPLSRFVQFVESAGVTAASLEARGDELFLAAAVLAQDPRALAYLDREYLARAIDVLSRVDDAPDFVAEVRQLLRVNLVAEQPPRLAHYTGVGALLAWLRVVALRTALNLKRAQRRLVPAGRPDMNRLDPLDPLLSEGDIERAALKRHYLPGFRQALEAAFRRLAPRERTLLRLFFIDGLNIEAIGNMYGVHRATVARWLVTIRQGLFREARLVLGDGKTFDSRSLRSLYRLLADDLHLTASRLLKTGSHQ
jgi:RNA polymerase sigma-70 factor (ECF subfamily)